MPVITDVDSVRAKLEIASSAKDDAIRAVLARVEAWVLSETGLTVTSSTVVEVHEQVQIAAPFNVRKPPVSALTSIEGRFQGASGWSALTGDLLDASTGRVAIVGNLGTFEYWPPRDPRADIFAWHDFIWPLVRVTYATPATAAPDDLKDATAALAAYWFERDQAGILKSVSLDKATDTFLTDFVPPWLRPIFGNYTPKPPSWV